MCLLKYNILPQELVQHKQALQIHPQKPITNILQWQPVISKLVKNH